MDVVATVPVPGPVPGVQSGEFMEVDDLSWRWPAEQLDRLSQIAQAGEFNRDSTNSGEALATRLRAALHAGRLVDDLVNRLMLALLEAGYGPAEVAEVMGLASARVVTRRAQRERRRLQSLAADVDTGPRPRRFVVSGTAGGSPSTHSGASPREVSGE